MTEVASVPLVGGIATLVAAMSRLLDKRIAFRLPIVVAGAMIAGEAGGQIKPDLQHVELNRTKITEHAVKFLFESLPGLRGIQLDGTQITDSAINYFRNGMFEAKLSNTAITDQSIEKLKTIRSLSHIFLTGTKISPDGVNELRQALPNCTVVY